MLPPDARTVQCAASLTFCGTLCDDPDMRYALPLTGTVVCLTLSWFTPPIVAYVLIFAAFGCAMDAGTAWLARAGGTGGLKDFKQ